jgi:hypothetical protein
VGQGSSRWGGVEQGVPRRPAAPAGGGGGRAGWPLAAGRRIAAWLCLHCCCGILKKSKNLHVRFCYLQSTVVSTQHPASRGPAPYRFCSCRPSAQRRRSHVTCGSEQLLAILRCESDVAVRCGGIRGYSRETSPARHHPRTRIGERRHSNSVRPLSPPP